MRKMMESQCSFSKILPACGNLCGSTALVLLKDCRDEISGHLQSVHLSTSNLLESELILARAGMFGISDEKVSKMVICSKHRRYLGKGWRPLRSCQYPSHAGKMKQVHGRHVVNLQMSQDISMLFSVTVPVGSRKYKLYRERHKLCGFFFSFLLTRIFIVLRLDGTLKRKTR